jgi:ferredoxin
MSKLQIEGHGTYEITEGKRLVNAIEDCGVDIGHRCGGNARCTTCRVQFLAGEPPTMTKVEYEKLKSVGLLGQIRLSCQIVLEQDMSIQPLIFVSEKGWDNPGPRPQDTVTPEAAWYPIAQLKE